MKSHAISRNIRKAREAQGLTQKDLAAKVGCASQYLSDIECLRRPVPLEWLVRVCKALSMTLDEALKESA